MLLMGISVLRVTDDEVELAVTLPPGFDIDRIEGESLRVNGELPALRWQCDPRRSRPSDLFRVFRAQFSRPLLSDLVARDGRYGLRVSGRLLGGAHLEGAVQIPSALRAGKPSAAAGE